MDINTLRWKPELCKLFGAPPNMLPNILNCSDNFGHTNDGIPINGYTYYKRDRGPAISMPRAPTTQKPNQMHVWDGMLPDA
jgi:hypothetical protein